MAAPPYENALAALPALTRKQLEEIRRRAAFLLQQQSAKQAPLEDEDWLTNGLLVETRRRGLGPPPGPFVIRGHKSFSGFSTQVTGVRAFLEQEVPNMTLLEKRLLGIICGQELALFLESKYDLSLSVVLSCVNRVPVALEKAFPGYMTAGLLHVVIHKGAQGAR